AAAADAAAVGAIKATAVGGEVAVVDVDVDVDVDADADADEFPRPTIPSATAALCRFPSSAIARPRRIPTITAPATIAPTATVPTTPTTRDARFVVPFPVSIFADESATCPSVGSVPATSRIARCIARAS